MTRFRAILFDLDGTLVDTAPDLGYALNELLKEQGSPPIEASKIRAVASHGSEGLLRLGFGVDQQDPRFVALQQRFLSLYEANLLRQSALFNGFDTILNTLDQLGIRWGVVTNKPTYLTEPILSGLGLLDRLATVVCGDTLPQRKPDPAPLFHATKMLGLTPQECLYLGDAERDVQAAKNAKMPVLIAHYGYLSQQDMPEQWCADGHLHQPMDLLRWL